jgi:PAS domain S-box-containing protein
MTVAAQLRVAIAVLVIALSAILIAAFYVPAQLERSAQEQYVEDVIPLQRKVQDLNLHLAQQEVAVEGYLRTNDPVLQQRFYASNSDSNDVLAQIKTHVERHPELEPLIRRAVIQIGDLQRIDLQRITPATTPAARTAAEKSRARAFGQFRQTVSQMLAYTDRYVDTAARDQRARYEQLLVVLATLGFVALAIGLSLFIVVPRRVGQLYEAEQHSRREAEGRAEAARALAHVSDGVILTDSDGRIRFWNPAAEELIGIDERGALGRELARLLPGWERLARQPEGQSGFGGAAVLPINVGHERWLSVMSVDFGEGAVYAIRDVTEERALERLRSEFVATASHELRTPMTSISGAARTLLRHGSRLPPERHETFLEMIVGESDRLSRIVDQILVASRIEAGEIDVRAERCDVVEITHSVVEAAQHRAPQDLLITVDAAPVPDVECDPDRLRQILWSIIDNAIKYSPGGGEVRVELTLEDDVVRFAVRDEGIGFDPAAAELIFERFRRLDPHQTEGIGGTGLGLYIARELVRRLGGRIWAESERGRGTSFYFELPLAAHVHTA